MNKLGRVNVEYNKNDYINNDYDDSSSNNNPS